MISENPQNAWAYTYLGSAWVCFDSLGKAETAFRKAREINPGLTFNLFRLAFTCNLREKYKEAIDILKEIPALNPDETFSAWYDLGASYQMMGDQESARRYLSDYRKNATED